MGRNEQHSALVKELRREQRKFCVYENVCKRVKQNISYAKWDQFEYYRINEFCQELNDCRYMLRVLSLRIKKLKEQIRQTQQNFAKKQLT